MKTLSASILLIFMVAFTTFGRTKTVEKSFPVKSSQTLEFSNLGVSHIKIKSWDKDEVYIKIKFSFSSSKDEYAENVVKSFDIVISENDSMINISSKRIGNESTWSYFLGIKFRLFFYESTEIEGEIFVPRKNPFKSRFQYSSISLEGMNSSIELLGSGNIIEVKNCKQLNRIENNYGKITITDCAGNLTIKSTSSDININGLSGFLNIDGAYSEIVLKGITRSTYINTKSGKHIVSDIGGDLTINTAYSTIQIDKINGFVDVRNEGGNINIKNVGGVKINANYSQISINSVTGKNAKDIYIKGYSETILLENLVGNVTIKSPNSPMELKNITGDVSISGSSCDIYGEKITGNWNSQSPYTKLVLRELSARNVTTSGNSSPVDIVLLSVPNDINIRNNNGNVSIQMPCGFSGDVNLSTSYGNVSTNLPITLNNFNSFNSSSKVSGKVDGGSGKILIETSSADILLTQKSK